MKKYDFKEITDHLKDTGFFFHSSEIYGGLANSWDVGPLGSILKNELKNQWIKEFVYKEKSNHLIDSEILLNSSVWKSSGHIDTFTDLLTECRKCNKRYKVEDILDLSNLSDIDQINSSLKNSEFKCSNCKSKENNLSEARNFNLMFELNSSKTNKEGGNLYLRPETAQGIFINFKNIQRTTRSKLPIGVCQIGKAFRNEITPGNFIFRTKEFEMMEIEVFTKDKNVKKTIKYYKDKYISFLGKMGIEKKNLKAISISDDELAHYSRQTIDINYKFPFGLKELIGIADRGTYDLERHQKESKQDLTYFDTETNSRYLPSVVEPSIGVERLMLAILCESYNVEKLENDYRKVLKLPFSIAPYQIAILPLVNSLHQGAYGLYSELVEKSNFRLSYDKSGSIGKRYRRQDAIGTNYVVTYDHDSLSKKKVTIRFRDSMEQKKVSINRILSQIEKWELKNEK